MSVISSTSPVNEEFKRPSLYKIRRQPLFNYLQALGMKFDHVPPITELQNIVISRGIDVSPLTGEIKPIGEPSDNTVEMAQMMEKMAALQEELHSLKAAKEEVKSFDSMGVFELRKVCKDRGIEFDKKATKQELLDALDEPQDAA